VRVFPLCLFQVLADRFIRNALSVTRARRDAEKLGLFSAAGAPPVRGFWGSDRQQQGWPTISVRRALRAAAGFGSGPPGVGRTTPDSDAGLSLFLIACYAVILLPSATQCPRDRRKRPRARGSARASMLLLEAAAVPDFFSAICELLLKAARRSNGCWSVLKPSYPRESPRSSSLPPLCVFSTERAFFFLRTRPQNLSRIAAAVHRRECMGIWARAVTPLPRSCRGKG